MKRLALILPLLFPLQSIGQQSVVIVAKTLINNTYTIGRTSASPVTLTARTLSTTAGQNSFVGLSRKESVVRVHSSVTDKFIGNSATEHHRVTGVTIDGQRYADTTTSDLEAVVSDCVELTGLFNQVDNCLIEQFYGSAVKMRQGQLCFQNIIENSFIGIDVISSDCMIANNIVHGCRDYGIKVSGATGNVVSIGNHYYGHERAGYVTSATFQAIGDMYADSSYGLYLETSGSRVQDCTFQHNHTANIVVTGPGMILSDNLIDVQRVTNWSADAADTYGVLFEAAADASRLEGGIINFTTYVHGSSTATTDPVTGIQCAADQVYIDCNIHDNNTASTVSQGLEIIGAVNGITFKIRTAGGNSAAADGSRAGFHDSGDQIVIVPAAADTIYGEIWIAGRASKAIADYVTLEEGWDGTITIYDVDAGGAPTVYNGPTAR